MFINSKDEALIFDADVTIVGSGPAGISLALEIGRRGLKALVLESGIDQASQEHQNLALADKIDFSRHDDMAIATSRRLGGTSNLWGARCLPYDPIDFDVDRPFCNVPWPIQLSDLQHYFNRSAEILHIGPPVFRGDMPRLNVVKSDFEINHKERFSNFPAIQKAHAQEIKSSKKIAVMLDATVININREFNCIKEVEIQGISRPKMTLQVKHLVLAAGGVETTRLLLHFQKNWTELAGGSHGALGKYYMGHFFGEVADIVISNPDLDEGLDFYIDDNKSYARHRFIPSYGLQKSECIPNVAFWPIVPQLSDARHGDPFLSMVFLAFAIPPLGRVLVAEAIRKRHVPEGVKFWPHIRNILRRPFRAMSLAPTFLWKRYIASVKIPGFFLRNPGRRYGLSYHAEQGPYAESSIVLSRNSDNFGLPRVDINLTFSRVDAEALLLAHEKLDSWLRAEQLGYLDYHHEKEHRIDAVLESACHGTHQIGTARMSETNETGCVDRNLKVFGADNLYVCSSAVFPTSGQCNPTFTIVALACRLADHIYQIERNISKYSKMN